MTTPSIIGETQVLMICRKIFERVFVLNLVVSVMKKQLRNIRAGTPKAIVQLGLSVVNFFIVNRREVQQLIHIILLHKSLYHRSKPVYCDFFPKSSATSRNFLFRRIFYLQITLPGMNKYRYRDHNNLQVLPFL